MQKLSFQDAFFLRAESPTCPCHVATLMIFSPPENCSDLYLRELADKLGSIREVWPVFGRKLKSATSTRSPAWIEAEDYEAEDHVLAYSLPKNGTMSDLLNLVARAHEYTLDRTRPLWQAHIIDGLPEGKFALYFKVHHSLIDGVGGVRLLNEMFSIKPSGKLLDNSYSHNKHTHHSEESISHAIKHAFHALVQQSKAIPEASTMLANFGIDFLRGKKDRPQLPFSAPHTILNGELTSRRRFITEVLPLKKLQVLGKVFGGTINDVLIAIFGGALRTYLLSQGQLPERSLDAGLPVSIKGQGSAEGNQLSFIICPFSTEESDPLVRIERIIKTTKKAKRDIAHMSPQASEDLATMTMVPFLIMTLTHASQKLPPVFNTIVSNVPGPRKKMYLEGSTLEHIFPLSIVTDGMGLNITVISYQTDLCIAITSAPGNEPDIELLGKYIRDAYKELLSLSKKV